MPDRAGAELTTRLSVKYYSEKPLVYVLVVFNVFAAGFGLFVLTDHVYCRPTSVTALTFAEGNANYYGMRYVENVCETEIKTRGNGSDAIVAIVILLVLAGLVAANDVCLGKLNRLHAVARGDVYNEIMRGEPPKPHETPAAFRSFALRFLIGKAVFMLGVWAAFVYFVIWVELEGRIKLQPDGSYTGGSLLTRYGSECTGRSMAFEDPTFAKYRCHLAHEATMQYFKCAVYVVGAILMLVMLSTLFSLQAFRNAYSAWVQERERQLAARTVRVSGEGASEDPELDASLVRGLRSAIRLGMGYFAAEPADGMPELVAKVIIGRPPSKEEVASMVGRMLHLDKPPPEEVAEVMYALLKAAMGQGMGDPGAMKELLLAAAMAWSDSERQLYMKGMLDVLKQQNRVRRQQGPVGPGAGLGPPATPRPSPSR